MTNLIFIGNGLDLYDEKRTSYKDFLEELSDFYLIEHYDYSGEAEYSWNFGEKNLLFFILFKSYKDKGWSDIEDDFLLIEKITTKKVKDNYFEDIIDEAAKFYFGYDETITSKRILQTIKDDFIEIKKKLKEFIRTANRDSTLKSTKLNENLSEVLDSDEKFKNIIVNFNYTSVKQSSLNSFLNDFNEFNIHGSVEKNIVFGNYGMQTTELQNMNKNTQLLTSDKINEIIKKVNFDNSKINILIIGHSLSDNDSVIIKSMFSSKVLKRDKINTRRIEKIIFTTHVDVDIYEKYKNIKAIFGTNKVNKIRKVKKIKVIQTSELQSIETIYDNPQI